MGRGPCCRLCVSDAGFGRGSGWRCLVVADRVLAVCVVGLAAGLLRHCFLVLPADCFCMGSRGFVWLWLWPAHDV